MKIGKNLRNLIFKSDFPQIISDHECIYMGERYTYPKVEHKEVVQICYKILDLIKI
jgi:hypothetical protein